MKFKVKYLQEGGPMAAEAAPAGGAPASAEGGAPAPAGAEGGGQDPLMQIAEMFAQALQSQDCAALSQGAEMFLQLIAQAQGGAGGGAPAQGGAPAEQPVYKSGGKFGKLQLKGKKPVTGKEPIEEDKKGAKMTKGAKY